MKRFRILSLLLLAFTMVFAVACGGGEDNSQELLDAKNITNVICVPVFSNGEGRVSVNE